jgi:hypothetical protein
MLVFEFAKLFPQEIDGYIHKIEIKCTSTPVCKTYVVYDFVIKSLLESNVNTSHFKYPLSRLVVFFFFGLFEVVL